jgi:hypothetical protein
MTTLVAVPNGQAIREAQRTRSRFASERRRPPSERIATNGRDAEAERAWEQSRLGDHHRRATAFALQKWDEQSVDAALADSFPASDPPSWTLGVGTDARLAPGRHGVVEVSSARAGHPAWWQGVIALFGAGIVAVVFSAAILVLGSVVALAVRMFVDLVAALVNVLG